MTAGCGIFSAVVAEGVAERLFLVRVLLEDERVDGAPHRARSPRRSVRRGGASAPMRRAVEGGPGTFAAIELDQDEPG